MITVAILTCERYDLTRKTVESFIKHNGRADFDFCYGDDASTDKRIHEFMDELDIPCLVKHKKRVGCSPTSDELVQAASKLDNHNPYLLYLQNDFETVRTISLEVIQELFAAPKVGWVRLYGRHKNDTVPGGNPTNNTHKAKPGKPTVQWSKTTIYGEEIEMGDIHWGYSPSINRMEVMTNIVAGAKCEMDVSIKAMHTGLLTARFVRNVTNHIGHGQSTPNGLYGKPGGSVHKPAAR